VSSPSVITTMSEEDFDGGDTKLSAVVERARLLAPP
jgi:hypothetical protein